MVISHRLAFAGLALGLGLVCIGALSPNVGLSSLFHFDTSRFHFDKFVHAGAFAGLSFLAAASLRSTKRYRWLALPVVASLGVLMELAQLYIPERTVSVGDILANLAGVLLGSAAWLWIVGHWPLGAM